MSLPAYLLSGPAFLADEALARVRAEVAADPLSELDADAADDITEVMEALHTSSLLGGTRLVVVRNADQLKKEQAENLLRYLEQPSPDAVLVLIADGRTKLDQAVRALGGAIALETPKGRKLVGWLRTRAKDHAMKLDERAAWAMIDSVGTDLRDLDAGLTQLSTGLGSGATVRAEDIQRAFPRLADERIYVFTDAIGDRKLSVAMTSLRRLLNQGDDPLMLFGALSAHIRRLLRARRLAEQGAAAVGDALGLPNWRAERFQRQAKAYREEELVAAMTTLRETDVEMKGGDLPPEAALERAVVQIVGKS